MPHLVYNKDGGHVNMSASKYFNQTARQTRSASRNAIQAIKEQSGSTARRKHVKIEYERNGNSTTKTSEATKDETHIAETASKYFSEESKPKKSKKESHWEPQNWRELLDNIKEMRKSRDAPVDILGCEKTADSTASPEVLDDALGTRGGGVLLGAYYDDPVYDKIHTVLYPVYDMHFE